MERGERGAAAVWKVAALPRRAYSSSSTSARESGSTSGDFSPSAMSGEVNASVWSPCRSVPKKAAEDARDMALLSPPSSGNSRVSGDVAVDRVSLSDSRPRRVTKGDSRAVTGTGVFSSPSESSSAPTTYGLGCTLSPAGGGAAGRRLASAAGDRRSWSSRTNSPRTALSFLLLRTSVAFSAAERLLVLDGSGLASSSSSKHMAAVAGEPWAGSERVDSERRSAPDRVSVNAGASRGCGGELSGDASSMRTRADWKGPT